MPLFATTGNNNAVNREGVALVDSGYLVELWSELQDFMRMDYLY